MDTTITEGYLPPTLTPLHYAVIDFPPIIVALLTLGFLAVAFWIGRNGYPHLRALLVFDRVSTVAIASGASGLVRVQGHAFPGDPVPEGYSTPKHVWHVSSRYDTRSSSSMARSGTYSVGKILVRDESGECLIDPIGALVVPGRSDGSVDRHLFGEATYQTEKSINTGDAVLALGNLRQKTQRPDRPADPRTWLRRGEGGVLLLSSKSERATRRHLQLRAIPATLLVLCCLAAAGWVVSTHLLAYPNASVGEYLRALTGRPVAR